MNSRNNANNTIKAMILVCVALLFPALTWAAPSVIVVEVMNFYCPHCFEVFKASSMLRQALEKRGGVWDVVPIFLGDTSAWPAIVYLNLPPQDRKCVETALFQAIQAQGLSLSDASSTCVVVTAALKNMSMPDCLARTQKADYLNHAKERLKNTENLMRRLPSMQNGSMSSMNLQNLPIFIIEKNHRIQSIFSYPEDQDTLQWMQAVVHALD